MLVQCIKIGFFAPRWLYGTEELCSCVNFPQPWILPSCWSSWVISNSSFKEIWHNPINKEIWWNRKQLVKWRFSVKHSCCCQNLWLFVSEAGLLGKSQPRRSPVWVFICLICNRFAKPSEKCLRKLPRGTPKAELNWWRLRCIEFYISARFCHPCHQFGQTRCSLTWRTVHKSDREERENVCVHG